MKHLVIGGCGFIGSNVANNLISKGDEVTVIDNLSRHGSERNLIWLTSKGVKFIRADIRDKNIFNPNEYDVVYLFAGQTAVTTSMKNPEEDFLINAVGTFNILETIRQADKKPKLLFSSTNKVYGNLKTNAPVDENTLLNFYTPYGCSKGTADQYVRDYARAYHIPTTVLRQSCIYGNRQWGTEDQGWLAWFAIQVLKNKPITIYGNGMQIRDMLYIDDLVELYDIIARAPREKTAGKIYNVGGGPKNATNLLDAIQKIGDVSKQQPQYYFDTTRPGDQPYFVSDNTKALTELGWQPRTNLEEGLSKLIYWLENNVTNLK